MWNEAGIMTIISVCGYWRAMEDEDEDTRHAPESIDDDTPTWTVDRRYTWQKIHVRPGGISMSQQVLVARTLLRFLVPQMARRLRYSTLNVACVRI